jgi:putative flippase GtrA
LCRLPIPTPEPTPAGLQLGGLGATAALLWLLVSHGNLGRVAGYAVTVPTVTVVTFLANRGWTFTARPLS